MQQALKAAFAGTVLLTFLSLFNGCATYPTPRYSFSADNIVALRRLHHRNPNIMISVKDLVPAKGSNGSAYSLSCRLGARVETADAESFAAYIKKALVDEMKIAEVYSPTGKLVVAGKIKKLNFSSNTGTWIINTDITIGSGAPFSVDEIYDYRTSYAGDSACRQTAQSFEGAVHELVSKIIAQPAFKKAFVHHSA